MVFKSILLTASITLIVLILNREFYYDVFPFLFDLPVNLEIIKTIENMHLANETFYANTKIMTNERIRNARKQRIITKKNLLIAKNIIVSLK